MNGTPANQRLESAPGVNRLIGTSREKRKDLTYDRLRELLTYNPKTGKFFRRTSRGRARAGAECGGTLSERYVRIGIDGKLYSAHRLAWLYVHGYLPENGLDHIDRDPSNNRIENLREVSPSCNKRNCGNPRTNTSGVKGVGWDKRLGKWFVHIMVDRRMFNLGRYSDFDDAVCARLAAEQCLGWDGCDSSSPAYKYIMAPT